MRVLIQVIHTLSRDYQARAVGTLRKLLLNEIPRAELEVLARHAGELLDLGREQSRLVRMKPPSRREQFEDCEPDCLLGLTIGGYGGTQ